LLDVLDDIDYDVDKEEEEEPGKECGNIHECSYAVST
jgi:hypothetical protein